MDADEFVYIVQQTAIAHRDSGDPNQLADAIHLISEHLHESIPGKLGSQVDESNCRKLLDPVCCLSRWPSLPLSL
jgi:hypothetical protein